CVAGGAGLIALAAVLAVTALVPLHRIEPYVVKVDETVGSIEVISTLKDSKETYSEALTKHFLLRYVIARESYSRQSAAANYETVSLTSAAPVARRYFEEFRPENPSSPLNTLGASRTRSEERRVGTECRTQE